MPNDRLVLAESFYSIQGEGPYMGVPSVFLRTGGCNLDCVFVDEDGNGNPCDTEHVWKNGSSWTFDAILDNWRSQGWLDALYGGAHLILTGGEPMIQQAQLIAFIDQLADELGSVPFIEIETNGTQPIRENMAARLSHINCSPKLASSSMPDERRYQPDVLKQIRDFPSAIEGAHGGIFKFVVTQESDVAEIQRDFTLPLQLSPLQVWLMPEGISRDQLAQKAPWMVDLCKRHGYCYSSRLQVHVWEEVTGV